MIRINLLAEARGGKRGAAKSAGPPAAMEGAVNPIPFIALLLLMIIPVCAVWGYYYMKNQTLQDQVQAKQTELLKYQGVREKVQNLEKRKEEYSNKVDQIKALKELQSMPVKLMNFLVEVLPEGAWYTRLTQKGDDVTLDGKARSIKTISTLSDQLVAQKEFGQIEMGDINQETVAGETIYSYKVKFKYYPAGPPKPDAGATGQGAKPPAGKS